MSRSRSKPIIGITLGDPQGIGPEVIQKALASPALKRLCQPVVFGDPRFFSFKTAKRLSPKQCGQLSAYYVKQSVHAALKGEVGAIVTAPIAKERWHLAGLRFPGHTEYLAKLSRAPHVRMMMAGPKLNVVLETIHKPLAQALQMLSTGHLIETIEIANRSLKRWWGLKRPRIAVAGLNPHAGENGMIGNEEKRIILPAVQRCQKRDRSVSGPWPPDTVFYQAAQGEFDAVICLYHDQGLIPFKLLHFKDGVNITLGLPFVRTSPDHGTAFDIAGKNRADPTSMIEAIKLAVRLAQ